MAFGDGNLAGDGLDVGIRVEGIHKEGRALCDEVVNTFEQETYVGPDRETYIGARHIHKVAGGGCWRGQAGE